MNTFVTNLKRQAEANPIGALVVGVVVLSAASKFLHTGVEMHNASVWRREVARRAMKDAIK